MSEGGLGTLEKFFIERSVVARNASKTDLCRKVRLTLDVCKCM